MCVCVCVHVYLMKADICRHAFSRFFSLFGAYTVVLDHCQFLFQKKTLNRKKPSISSI